MSDYMLLEYLKGRGRQGDDRELIEDFKHYMKARGKMGSPKKHRDYIWEDDYYHHDWGEDYSDYHKAKGHMYDDMYEDEFSEHKAKEVVSEMYHYEHDKRVIGEHFDMHRAKEALEKYKEHFIVKASVCDVYVAINAFYHDFINLFKTWFGTNSDEKIIMLAITFWFKDDDYQGNKLMDYFE